VVPGARQITVSQYIGSDLETTSGTTRLRLAWVVSGRFAALPSLAIVDRHLRIEAVVAKHLILRDTATGPRGLTSPKAPNVVFVLRQTFETGTPVFVGLRAVSELTVMTHVYADGFAAYDKLSAGAQGSTL
jgi:hypothetical protein